MIVLVFAFSSAILKGLEIYGKETLRINGGDERIPLLSENGRNGNNFNHGSFMENNDDNEENNNQNNNNNNNDNNNQNNNSNNNSGNSSDNNNNNNDTEYITIDGVSRLIHRTNNTTDARTDVRSIKSENSIDTLTNLKKTGIAPIMKIPYLIISVILIAWSMYAALYVSLQATTVCSWRYYLLLTM